MLKFILIQFNVVVRIVERLRSELKLLSFFESFGKGCRVYSELVIHKTAKVKLADDCTLQPYSFLQVMQEGVVEFGEKSTLGRFSIITCANKVTIGSKVMIGAYVQITDHSHGIDKASPMFDQQSELGKVTIADDVWIGSGAIILMNVSIGQGAIVGAGAVVNRDVPAYSIVAGVPASLVRYRP